MKILARIRVRETNGIRRFLYPLTTSIPCPKDIDHTSCGLIAFPSGDSVPCQISQYTMFNTEHLRLDFAISLAPNTEQDIYLIEDGVRPSISDPLHISTVDGGGILNRQERFQIEIGPNAAIQSVTYDGIAHLRGPSRILRNGEEAVLGESIAAPSPDHAFINATVTTDAVYPDNRSSGSQTQITACKSWATLQHFITGVNVGDEIRFELPFAASSPTLLYDLGTGGGIYGKLNAANGDTAIWRCAFTDTFLDESFHSRLDWSVLNNGRVDYQGSVDSEEQCAGQMWFHIIDGDKALAVAITELPAISLIEVQLNAAGDVVIRFVLGENQICPDEPEWDTRVFGVCYHFLNAIPPISAATNPQSILLPPVVEVLPLE